MKPMIPSETLEYLLKPQLQIHLVAVRSALIGTGLGKKLINHAFNDLKKRAVQYDGATHVSAAIPPHNVHAREVFEHLGFQKSKNPNTPFMEKPLKSFRIKF